MDVITAAGAGALVGLGLVMPLGAIGALLLREGLDRGTRAGLPAAAGVAVVDTGCCVAAVAAGSTMEPLLAAWSPWPQVIGGLTLLALGVKGILRARRGSDEDHSDRSRRSPSSGARRLGFFALATGLNPATLIYFAGAVTGLAGLLASAPAAAAFALSVGAASLAWNCGLVLAGSILRRRASPRLRAASPLLGHGLVALLGLSLVASALP